MREGSMQRFRTAPGGKRMTLHQGGRIPALSGEGDWTMSGRSQVRQRGCREGGFSVHAAKSKVGLGGFHDAGAGRQATLPMPQPTWFGKGLPDRISRKVERGAAVTRIPQSLDPDLDLA